jgi:hypothetical protein
MSLRSIESVEWLRTGPWYWSIFIFAMDWFGASLHWFGIVGLVLSLIFKALPKR